ncbi:secreted membrane-associated protein (FLGN family) [Cryptosporidium hominis]|uniref:Secreted membrane-associated protein (FLGN family) n=1 Tax=Cryptosporidium hominis TaxID=237895 RepID=A0ABX5BAP7_CRYHO|nr:secreted membrane-associated protein (FLGN family) [Cryptosporidium hominis]|eukprot:PPS92655.1 secreted membrane-associated protein (FLGN family) [Cryptosporidium hominis]
MKAIKLCFIALLSIILLHSFNFVRSEASNKFTLEEEDEPTTSTSTELSILDETRVKLLSEELIILEMDFFDLQLKNLLGTEFWFDLHKMASYKDIINVILEYWKHFSNPTHQIHKQNIVRFYVSNQQEMRKDLLSDYSGYHESSAAMVTKFVKNVTKYNCYRMKNTLALFYLIFGNDPEYLVSAFLLYLLICSFRELAFGSFSTSFVRVMKNEDQLGSKMIVLGGSLVSRLIFSIQRVCFQYYKVQYTISAENQMIRNPINTQTFVLEEFGFQFCLSLLELAANETINIDFKYLLLFFGSRMGLAAEVLLAFDILKEAIRLATYLIEAISLLLNDDNAFQTIVAKIMDLYGINIWNVKKRFNECILVKEKYPILNGIVSTTDYQKKARKRSRSRTEKSKISLRSKYSFF